MTTADKLEAIKGKSKQFSHIEFDGRSWCVSSHYVIEIDSAVDPCTLKSGDLSKPLRLALAHGIEIEPLKCFYFEFPGIIARQFTEGHFVDEVFFRLFPANALFFTDAGKHNTISVRVNGNQVGVISPLLVDVHCGYGIDPPSDDVLFPDKSTRDGLRLIELRKELGEAEEKLEEAEDTVSEWEETIWCLKCDIKELETSAG